MTGKKLTIYNQKRRFDVTSEPRGSVTRKKSSRAKKKPADERVFVVQKHNASHLHYDFRLEIDGTLASWAVPKGPSLNPKTKRLAMHVEDHPLGYATFEGVIPKGEYGAGQVVVWDFGSWEPVDPEDPSDYEKVGHLKFDLFGKKLKGRWALVRFRTGEKGDTWLLIKDRDKYAKPDADDALLRKRPESVLSKNTLARLAKQTKSVRLR